MCAAVPPAAAAMAGSMPNGERPDRPQRPQRTGHPHRPPRRQAPQGRAPRRGGLRHRVRGFSYLLLLFMLAILGAGLVGWASSWQVGAQRERETELLFRGLQIRDALQRFQDATPAGQPALPQALDDLLADHRGPSVRHHLRRLYADPFTGQPDWALLRDEAGGIVGLHSRAQRPALRRQALPAGVPMPENPTPNVSDWIFIIDVAAPPAARSSP